MDPLMIYILDERIPSVQLEDHLKKTQPLTKEQVVDLIISKTEGQDVIAFNAFKQKYETLDFKHNNNEKKHEMYHKDLAELEKLNQVLCTWNDPKELKSDLIHDLTSFHIIDQKSVLYNYQIQDWIKTATSWLILHKKKEYLDKSLVKLQNSYNNKIDSPDQTSGNTTCELKQNLSNATDEEPVNNVKEKKIPEKWYALLHMIYIQMKKEIPFEKKITKEELKEFGRKNYPIKGSGHSFYMAIRLIENKGIYKYIFAMTKSDHRKWKRTIIEISGNDQEIILWIDKNKN